eukprot:scaffold271389_cov21-Tisochrysis_lutea.AAC.2
MFAQDVADHASLSSQEGEGVAADPAEQHPGQAPAGSPLLYDALPDEVERAMQRLSQCKGGGIPQRRVGGVQGPDYSARAAAPWPRIYRKPLKRGSHVILDLCMPLEEHSAAQGKSSEEGSKQSGAVAGAQRVGAAGAPQGRLARQVRIEIKQHFYCCPCPVQWCVFMTAGVCWECRGGGCLWKAQMCTYLWDELPYSKHRQMSLLYLKSYVVTECLCSCAVTALCHQLTNLL